MSPVPVIEQDELLARIRHCSEQLRLAELAVVEARTRRDHLIVQGLASHYSRLILAAAAGVTPTRITHIAGA